MMNYRLLSRLGALLLPISMALLNAGERAEGAAQRMADILRENARCHRMTQPEELKQFGEDTVEILGGFLTDREVAVYAAYAMLQLDPLRAGPILFASMPKSDRNVQRHTFAFFIRLMQEGQQVSCQKEMHDAAVRCLDADTRADAREQALYAIGLTGDKSDHPILEEQFRNTHYVPAWKTKISDAAEAALARLGHQTYISNIERQLKKPIPSSFQTSDALLLETIIRKAAFSNNLDFVPLVGAHLKTRDPEHRGCVIASPARAAAKALNTLLKTGRQQEVPTPAATKFSAKYLSLGALLLAIAVAGLTPVRRIFCRPQKDA